MEPTDPTPDQCNLIPHHSEKAFNDLMEIASIMCNKSTALLSFLDSNLKIFETHFDTVIFRIPIEKSFCQYTIENTEGIFIIPDAQIDVRFKDNALVTDYPFIRFYAGVPLRLQNGQVIGALCVIDNTPGTLNEEQQRILKIIAAKISTELDKREKDLKTKIRLKDLNRQLNYLTTEFYSAQQSANFGTWTWDIEKKVFEFSPNLIHLFGFENRKSSEIEIQEWMNKIHPEDLPAVKNSLRASRETTESQSVEYRIFDANGTIQWMLSENELIVSNGKPAKLKGLVINITAKKEYTAMLEEILFSISHVMRRPVANMLGLCENLPSDNIPQAQIREQINYFKKVALEMDSYIRELNDVFHKRKNKFSVDSAFKHCL
ncbi:PAS domain-containing protein [Flavobacterium kingsejongi]|uniref:PAC domain-containing protein n=1 Tax=Flavobacterium kingsejongi TaxID=1678728 RepID=A0A2S1LS49_9FLAO|nr:PAS domain-containing protein [Flavobacterium kingsejongi]AWG26466.1 hypothetical protein FK004_15170 [Flavobacterium kingsejongi]